MALFLSPSSNIKIPNKVWIVLFITVCIAIYFWAVKHSKETDMEIMDSCESSPIYSEEKKLWEYFSDKGLGGYFATKQEAVNQCVLEHHTFW